MNLVMFRLLGLITLVIGVFLPYQSFGTEECVTFYREQGSLDSNTGVTIRLGFGENAWYLFPSDTNAIKRALFRNIWFETPSQKELFKTLINKLVFKRNKDVESSNKMDFEINFQETPMLGARFQFEHGSPSAGHLTWIPPQMNLTAEGASKLRSEFINWLMNDQNLPRDFWQTFSQNGPIFYARTGSLRSDLTFDDHQQGLQPQAQQMNLRNFLYMIHSLSLFLKNH